VREGQTIERDFRGKSREVLLRRLPIIWSFLAVFGAGNDAHAFNPTYTPTQHGNIGSTAI
jgi:hypothetical protein